MSRYPGGMGAALIAGVIGAAACGPAQPPIASVESSPEPISIESMLEEQRAIARTGLPDVQEGSYQAARARFLDDEAAYRTDPDRFFQPSAPIPCALDLDFEAYIGSNDPTWATKTELLEGACVGGRFEGQVVYRQETTRGQLRHLALTTATFVDGKKDGYATTYVWSNARRQTDNPVAAALVRDASFTYTRMEAGALRESYQFEVRDDDPAFHRAQVETRLDDRRRLVRTFLGSKQELEYVHFEFDGGFVAHGLTVYGCFDYGRQVMRSPCPHDMPPTAGVPSDLAEHEPRATAEQVEATIRQRKATIVAGSREALARRRGVAEAEAPAPKNDTPRSSGASVDGGGPAPRPGTAPPQERVKTLCGAAAHRQAELYAPTDPKLQKELRASFATSCAETHWSVERIECAMRAPNADALKTCNAMPSAPPAVPAGDPAACRAAAQHQARLTAGSDAALERTLAESIEAVCKRERWPSARTGCVRAAASADEAGRCVEARH